MQTKLIIITDSLNNWKDIDLKDRFQYLNWVNKPIYILSPHLEEKQWKLFIKEMQWIKKYLEQLKQLKKQSIKQNFNILNWDITNFIKDIDSSFIFYDMDKFLEYDNTIKLINKYNNNAIIKNYWISEINNKEKNDILLKEFKRNNKTIKLIQNIWNEIITNKVQFNFEKQKWKVFKITNWSQWDWVYLINKENKKTILDLLENNKNNDKFIIQENIENDWTFRFLFSYNSITNKWFFFIYRRNKAKNKFLDNIHKWNDDISFIWHIWFKIVDNQVKFIQSEIKLNIDILKTTKYENVKKVLWFKDYKDILLQTSNELTQFILDYNKKVNNKKHYFIVIWFDIFIEKQWVYLLETNLFPWTKWIRKYWYSFYDLI